LDYQGEHLANLTRKKSGWGLLTLLTTSDGKNEISEVVDNFTCLVGSLDAPLAFFVRLLSPESAEFANVEWFFREVVDTATQQFGYRRAEIGTDTSRKGFMNVEIFETLHYTSIVIADVTGLRPNCFIELGYALGRGHRVIVTAMSGTKLPFDQQAIPRFFWRPTTPAEDTLRDFLGFIVKYLNRPPLVM
jgi:hypothetical protein